MASYADLFNQIPIPWLTQNPQARAFWKSWATLLDGSANSIKSAVLSSFPDTSPDDALPHLSSDIGLLQGAFPVGSPSETNAQFRARLKNAFSLWQYGGSQLSLLLALYWLGYSNKPMIIQQNGVTWTLNSSSIPNNLTDYTSYLTRGFAGVRGGMDFATFLLVGGAGAFVNGDTYLFTSSISASSGAASLVRHEGTGTGTMAVTTGSFSAHRSILMTCTATGSNSTATFTLTVDGYQVATGLTGPTIAHEVFNIPWWTISGGRDDLTNRYVIVMQSAPAWWTLAFVPANPQSLPSDSELNLIWRAAQLYGPGKARLTSLLLPATDNLWGWPLNKTWGAGTWGGDGSMVRWGNPLLVTNV